MYKSLVSWLVSGGGRGIGLGSICLGCGVLGLALVGDISHVSSISVYCVGHLLQTTVRESHVVATRGGVAISVLAGSVVVAGVIVLDGVRVGVLGGLLRVGGSGFVGHWGRSVRGGSLVGPGQGGGGEDSQGDEDLGQRGQINTKVYRDDIFLTSRTGNINV